MGYWQIVISNAPVKTCPTCQKQFKSKEPDAIYCSPGCLAILQRRLEDKPCKWCAEMFRPKDHTKVYCSPACRDAQRVHEWKTSLPKIACQTCSEMFQPGSPQAKFCSEACYRVAKNARRNAAWVKKTRAAECTECGRAFTAAKSTTLVCSAECRKARASRIEKEKRRKSSPFICEPILAVVHRSPDITPQRLDWFLMERGLRITAEVKIAA